MRIRYLYLVIMGLLLFNCWSRQNHDITKPIIPHYIFNGTAIDMDSGDPLPGTRIKLEQVNMMYDVDFGTRIINADSTGYFQFDTVYPGSYNLSMERNNYFINKTQIQIQHMDTTAVLEIPLVKIAYTFSATGQGLAINGTKAWFLSMGDDTKRWWLPADIIRIYSLSLYYGWKFTTSNRYYLDGTVMYAMTFGHDGVYCTAYPDSIYMFNTYDASIAADFQIDKNVTGIAYHIGQQTLYTCYKSNIYKHDQIAVSHIIQTFPMEYPDLRAMAYYRNLFVWDSKLNLLFQLDNDMHVIGSYALLYESGEQIDNIYDMSFDGYGRLWVIGEYSQ